MEGSTLREEGVGLPSEMSCLTGGQLLSPGEDTEGVHGGWRSIAVWIPNGTAVLSILKVLQAFCERLIKCAQVRNLLRIYLKYKTQ